MEEVRVRRHTLRPTSRFDAADSGHFSVHGRELKTRTHLVIQLSGCEFPTHITLLHSPDRPPRVVWDVLGYVVFLSTPATAIVWVEHVSIHGTSRAVSPVSPRAPVSSR